MARYNIFRLGQFGQDAMPCTENVLLQHLKRTTYQSCIWKKALQQIIAAPSINGYGWSIIDNKLEIIWMTVPPAPDVLLENVNCKCQSGCITRRCSCRRTDFKCSSLCGCSQCLNSKQSDSDTEEDEQELDETLRTFDDDDVNNDYFDE